ncbi:MAG: hypothetical protein K9H25_06935 [Rhodospirillum sp.]|nr:hypothetical protein [Rhodospirillum sp.]MCF8487742.1 hypothetical protein [Rhodospirillum sp.]MCF8500380.1 hypothetical protein [Rhodospirillum sp.]
MSAPPRLYMAVTSHGYGHLSLCASVAEALRARLPGVQVTVDCALDPSPFFQDITHEPRSLDFGLVMRDARTIDRPASAARYRALHDDWEGTLAHVCQVMAAHAPDLVLSCSGYLAVAAAHRLRIPVLGLGPLNWLDIGRFLFREDPAMAPVLTAMAESYALAEGWFIPTPSMPQEDLPNRLAVGVISQPGRRDRRGLADALGLDPARPLTLVNFGGLSSGLDARQWARQSGDWVLLAVNPAAAEREVFVDAQASGWAFRNILASADAVVGKAGYGMLADCAAAGLPMLLVDRGDWPEAPYLEEWFFSNARGRRLTEKALAEGRIGEELERLVAGPPPARIRPTGAEEVAAHLAAALR